MEFLRTGRLNKIGIPEDDPEALQEILEESDFYGTIALSKKLYALLEKCKERVFVAPAVSTKNQPASSSSLDTTTASQAVQDEDWLVAFDKLTLQQKEQEQIYFQSKEQQLDKSQQKLTQEKQDLLKMDKKAAKLQLRLNVQGRIFVASLETFTKHKGCILNNLFSKLSSQTQGMLSNIARNFTVDIFLDNDPEVFAYILEYLKSGSTKQFPADHFRLKQIKEDAKFFNITSLVEYFDPLRYAKLDIAI